MESANMLILSKEASEKDHSLKTQLLNKLLNSFHRSSIWGGGGISGEVIWQKLGFFQDERADFNIEKKTTSQECLDLHKSDISLNCSKW